MGGTMIVTQSEQTQGGYSEQYDTGTMITYSKGGTIGKDKELKDLKQRIKELEDELKQSKRSNRILTDQIEELQSMNDGQRDDMIKENIKLGEECDMWKERYENVMKENIELKSNKTENECEYEYELDENLINEINDIVINDWSDGNENESNNNYGQYNNGNGNGNNNRNDNGNNNNNSNGSNGSSNNGSGGGGMGTGGTGRDKDDDDKDKKRKKYSNNCDEEEEKKKKNKKEKEEQKKNIKAEEFIPKNNKNKKYICISAPIDENKQLYTKSLIKGIKNKRISLSKSQKQEMNENKSDYSYSPNKLLRAKGNIKISKILTDNKNGIISNRIKDSIGNLYFYIDKTTALMKHKSIKLNNNNEITIIT